jgi:hypothetical protein
MKTIRRTFVVVAAMFHVPVFAGEIWVAPNGSDTAAGTFERPLATPAMALRRAREWRRLRDPAANDGVTIRLRQGEYGTAGKPTTIKPADGERALISGGVKITGWKRREPAGRGGAADAGNLWVADIPTFNGRPLEFRQLWVNGRKAVRARTPNGDAMERLTAWNRPERIAGIPASARLPESLRGVEMVILQAWEIAVLRLKSAQRSGDALAVTFHEPESRVQFEHPWPQPPINGKNGNAAFYLVNAFAFLDAPGEWYADHSAGKIYYAPRDGEDMAQAEVVAPAVENLVRIVGSLDRPVQHVRIEGVAFAHTTWLRPSHAGHVPLQAGFFLVDAYGLKPKGTPDWRSLDNQAWLGRPPGAVHVQAAHGIQLINCRFERLAASGIDFGLGVKDSSVEGCELRDIGINGIVAGSFGEEGIEAHLPYDPADDRERTERVRIFNNLIEDCANEDWGGIPVIAGFVRDTAIEHNEIRDTSYTGISVGWGWTRTANAMRNNRVHANLLERVATRTADNAGIYTLSNQPGTVVSENVVHEIRMSPYVHDPDHWFYLYTDEGSSFITVRDNWCPAEKFLQNANGPGNIWTNNGPMVSEEIRKRAGRKR